MPPIPSTCQPLANDVATLQSQAQTLRTDVQTAVGTAAWTKLSQLGLVLQQLDRKTAEYDACIAAHSGDLVCDVVFIDAAGGGVSGDRVAHLWDVSASPPTRLESVPVENGSFAFVGPIPAGNISIAIGADSSTAGPDFRSGSIPVPPTGSARRIEVVIGPLVKVTPSDLARWLSRVSFDARRIDTGAGTLEVTATSIAAALGPDTITLSAVGTVSLVAVIGQAQMSPFSASVSMGFVPSTTPAAIVPIEPKKLGTPDVQVGGPLALLGAALNVALGFGLWDMILNQVRDIAREEVTQATAQALSLLHLPPDLTLSVRSLSIDPSGITFQPTLGAFGTVLSSYQPDASILVSV